MLFLCSWQIKSVCVCVCVCVWEREKPARLEDGLTFCPEEFLCFLSNREKEEFCCRWKWKEHFILLTHEFLSAKFEMSNIRVGNGGGVTGYVWFQFFVSSVIHKPVGLGIREIKCKRRDIKSFLSSLFTDAILGVQVAGPTDTLIAGNSTALISCMATSGDVESTSWMKDGKPLTASDRLVFADTKNSLTIKGLQKEDNGEYVCQMSNAVNSEKSSYNLVVNCECLFCWECGGDTRVIRSSGFTLWGIFKSVFIWLGNKLSLRLFFMVRR